MRKSTKIKYILFLLILILSPFFGVRAEEDDVINGYGSIHLYSALESNFSFSSLENSAAKDNGIIQPTNQTENPAQEQKGVENFAPEKNGFNLFGWLVKIL